MQPPVPVQNLAQPCPTIESILKQYATICNHMHQYATVQCNMISQATKEHNVVCSMHHKKVFSIISEFMQTFSIIICICIHDFRSIISFFNNMQTYVPLSKHIQLFSTILNCMQTQTTYSTIICNNIKPYP